MWNKRRDDGPARPLNPIDSTIPNTIARPDVKKETTTMANMPSAGSEPEGRGIRSATIGKAVRIVGQIHSREDLYVDGDVDGSIEAPETAVTVGPNGTVNATIKARDVIVLGTIRGNLEVTERVEIRKDAKLTGDIWTARITIEDGAYFKGSIDIVKPEPVARQAHAAVAISQPSR
jgi:cytoskeletal protein CcmA (bactofilin family)